MEIRVETVQEVSNLKVQKVRKRLRAHLEKDIFALLSYSCGCPLLYNWSEYMSLRAYVIAVHHASFSGIIRFKGVEKTFSRRNVMGNDT